MNFGQHMKDLRSKEGLTQEQLAQQLCVTRQAVSNWETGKNLPDLEILIQLSSLFSLSRDQLILGEGANSQLAEKLIRDNQERKHAWTYLFKDRTFPSISPDGFLQEAFYLQPLGYGFIFLGTACNLLSCLTIFLHKKGAETHG